MFNKKFGTNTNFDADSTTGIVEDATSIMETIDYPVLKAAWEEYITIKARDPEFLYADATVTPTWSALECVVKYDGDLKKFTGEEQHLLRALKKGFYIYADILHTLIDHHDDQEAARDVYAKYPDIYKYIPEEYNNPEQLIQVILEIVKDYQWQLERFAQKHEKAMKVALKKNAHLAAPRRSQLAQAEKEQRGSAIEGLDI